jgi:hypothetical protein
MAGSRRSRCQPICRDPWADRIAATSALLAFCPLRMNA